MVNATGPWSDDVRGLDEGAARCQCAETGVETLAGHRSPAVLMRSHGVFTIGRGPRDAIKAAVMCEDVARTVHLARALGTPIPLTGKDIDALYDRYHNVYGQR